MAFHAPDTNPKRLTSSCNLQKYSPSLHQIPINSTKSTPHTLMTSSRQRNRQLFNEYFTLSQWRCAHGEPDTKRRMKVPCADVGCGDEMCDERVEYMAWNGDCLRTCQEKGRDVRRQKATQSVCQGLPAQMSVGEVRHAQTRCHRKHRMKIGCADVGIEAEMCDERVEYTA